MVNFGPLMAEVDWWVWGTLANFNWFLILALLLRQCHSTEANQTYVAFKSFILLYWQRCCMAVEQWASVKLCGVQQGVPPILGRAAITLGHWPTF